MISKKNSLLFGLLSMALMSCGSHAELDEIVKSDQEESKAFINISVTAPSSDDVVVTKVQTTNESAINNMTVYLFKKGATIADTDYTFHTSQPFGTAELQTSGTSKSCEMKIPTDLLGETVKIAIVANDAAKLASNAEPVKDVTTLADFKKSLASATVKNNDKADALVGNGTAGFPMSCIVADDKVLTVEGASVSAALTRNVARLDIFNNVPNLTVTGVSIEKVNDKSCIFAADAADALNLPASLGAITLNPLQAFTQKLTPNGLAYVSGTSVDDIKTKNTYTLAYLYEQEVSAGLANSPEVKISYSLMIDGKQKPGSVTVKFEKIDSASAASTPVKVQRNYLYTIKLGEGKNVSTGYVNASFVVADWVAGEEINEDLAKPQQ